MRPPTSSTRECFERNVRDADLLGGFFTDYRIPHADMDGTPLAVGDEVSCHYDNGSWLDGKRGIVLKLGCQDRAGVSRGHLLQMDGSITIGSVGCVRKVSATGSSSD